MGLPTPNVFAGEHNFHSRLEWVSVQDMEKAVEVIIEYLPSLGRADLTHPPYPPYLHPGVTLRGVRWFHLSTIRRNSLISSRAVVRRAGRCRCATR